MIERMLGRTRYIEKSLNAASLRNDAIAQNIANVDTPGYKRKEVAFEELLAGSMGDNTLRGNRTDPRHIPLGGMNPDDVTLSVSEDQRTNSMRLDGNNVDIESEMSLLSKNSIKFGALVQRLSGQFRSMKSVISEGGK